MLKNWEGGPKLTLRVLSFVVDPKVLFRNPCASRNISWETLLWRNYTCSELQLCVAITGETRKENYWSRNVFFVEQKSSKKEINILYEDSRWMSSFSAQLFPDCKIPDLWTSKKWILWDHDRIKDLIGLKHFCNQRFKKKNFIPFSQFMYHVQFCGKKNKIYRHMQKLATQMTMLRVTRGTPEKTEQKNKSQQWVVVNFA